MLTEDLRQNSLRQLRYWNVVLFALVATALVRPSHAKPVVAKPRCQSHAVLVPSGDVPIGTPRSMDYPENEQPRRIVHIEEPYCIDRTEVSVGRFKTCVAAGRCVDRVPFFGRDEHPMTNVDWFDASDFCAFAGGRLPTEVEWEHAARGMDDRLYPWGDGRPWCERADVWHDQPVGACHGYGPSFVGSLLPGASPYGALDMAGNVLEWVRDGYRDDAWRILDDEELAGPIVVDGNPVTGSTLRHSVRGGSWDYDVAHGARVSERDGYPANERDAALGFRCLSTAE